MKSLVCIALFFAPCTGALCGEVVGSRLSKFVDTSYVFELSRSALDKAPKWEAGAANPPLSAVQAREIALAYVKRLRPEVGTWRLDLIGLEPIGDTDWIYLVKYSDRSGPIAGVPWSLEIPVYMDGTIPVAKRQ